MILKALAALALLLPLPAQEDNPPVATIANGTLITIVYEDMSTLTMGVDDILEFATFTDFADAATDPGDYLESEWVDRNGLTQRVRTRVSAGRTAEGNVNLHAERVRLMMLAFPQRPVTE